MTSSTSSSSMEKAVPTQENIPLQSVSSQVPKIHEIYSDRDFITLGNQTFRRSDFLEALGSDDEYLYESKARRQPRKLANPVPLGLASFSLSCLVLSLINANVRGVTNNKLAISLYMFFGGAIELFAGLLCFVTGDTFSMTVFSSFGGFWISWGCINTDQFHSITGYGDDTRMLNNAIGFFLAAWTVFTFLMLMCTLKSSWGLFLLLLFLDLTFLLLCIGSFIDNNNVKMAGGYFGILSSCCGWYSLYCMVVDPSNSYFAFNAHMMPNAPTV
ncbi:putative ammonium permease ATO3 NDAI_0A04410 [Naumovozyma dairenensis CBS 421]|uniref:Ammonia transport outward protein 3 n=1 Tax=Naumovozyma dairenensis (strain ATCC 10597 / BCRC 20456 / CBS 421 / NBRC 0211 / NRRL Y-12639) TaxID=1071378 RepID=G0W459_NAUDC|nr:hypothetical protein NDAI_0A04410 [Naumovozyma dairenensis CBS 421]CCD22597.1 hypothetical protein NDAI_0A04410 [Naumovozyma dairenensis CBS 421]